MANEKLDAVMQKRRENVERWRMERNKRAASAGTDDNNLQEQQEQQQSAATSSKKVWSLDKDDDESDEEEPQPANVVDNLSGNDNNGDSADQK